MQGRFLHGLVRKMILPRDQATGRKTRLALGFGPLLIS